MLVTSEVKLESIILHKVGNKSRDEGYKLSKGELQLDDFVKELLLKYFLNPFKSEVYYNLHHETDINLNEVFAYASAIFDNPETLYENSVNLAKHLYEKSDHAKIKEGEFYVTFLKDCVVHGEAVDAIGLFKSESKEPFLKVYPNGDSFDIDSEDGININKLDKGALIFNTDRDLGFMVATVDNVSKNNEALYWKDEFLRVKNREDIYYHTQNMMKLCKDFVEEHLPEQFEINRADQADLLNKSVSYLREKESFNIREFQNEVIAQPDLIESFQEFKTQYATNNDIPVYDEFDISASAVKKQSKYMKSIIKLDKNFHIYVHGQASDIEKGYDDARGMSFYKLYFREES